jgi:dUTP pyrophosphatase
VKWKRTRDEGSAPERGNNEDAGWDLVACEETVIEPGTWGNVPVGIAVELPYHTWGMITGRSSTLMKRKLLVSLSVIDSGFRGELFVFAWNLNDERAVVEKGARIGQLIVIRRSMTWDSWLEVESLSDSLRGTNGFGSTGA